MIIKPPTPLFKIPHGMKKIFLAGSIEMGKAENWQDDLGKFFASQGIASINPRRDEWDENWIQSIENPHFNQQVNWEINGLEYCDHIVVYLAAETLSPISLLEVGLFANSKKVWIICDPKFWRRGNVEVICERFQIPLFDSLNQFKTFFCDNRRELMYYDD